MREKQIHHQRLTDRIDHYWHRICKEDSMPSFHKLNSGQISDVWSYCFVIKISGYGAHRIYEYNYVGDAIREVYGQDLRGKVIFANITNVPGAQVLKHIGDCVESKEPIGKSGQFFNTKSKLVKYRSIMAPFGDHQGEVTHVLVGLSWKIFG